MNVVDGEDMVSMGMLVMCTGKQPLMCGKSVGNVRHEALGARLGRMLVVVCSAPSRSSTR